MRRVVVLAGVVGVMLTLGGCSGGMSLFGGDDKPVAFSSGLAMMIWTLLNARNGKPSLLTDHPLPNVGRIVLTGNPITGWTLVDWDGITNFSMDAA